MLSLCNIMPCIIVLHIITHGIVKRPIFILSGIWIHAIGSQDVRSGIVMIGYYVGMLLLMRFGVSAVTNSKEYLLFGDYSSFLLFLVYVYISMRYSLVMFKQGFVLIEIRLSLMFLL